MTLHYFTSTERQQQLRTLAAALERLLAELELSGHYQEQLSAYHASFAEARRLLENGFNQEDLSSLSRNVPRLFWLHKDWLPPLEKSKNKDGAFSEPAWFQRLAPVEEQVSAAAEKLRIIGEY